MKVLEIFFEVAEIYSRTSAFSIQHCVVLLSLYCMIVTGIAQMFENVKMQQQHKLVIDTGLFLLLIVFPKKRIVSLMIFKQYFEELRYT